MRKLGMLGAALAGITVAAFACSSDEDDDDDSSGNTGATPGVTTGPGTSFGTGTGTDAATATNPGGGTATDPGAGTGTGTGAQVVADPSQYLAAWQEPYFDACQSETQIPEPYNVVLMLVVDVSGSMTQVAPGTAMTKWDATKQALSQVVQYLPPSVAMGMVFYPNLDPQPLPHTEPTEDLGECVNSDIESGAMVAPGLLDDNQKGLLQGALNNVIVAGGTPTHSAYTVGLQSLEATDLPGNKYMLLITDGEPTYGTGCVGNGTTLAANMDPAYITDTIAAIGSAYNDLFPPIGTFVIGSPGSEMNYSGADARPWLSDAAIAGMTAPLGCSSTGSPMFCHFDLTDPNTNFASGLTNALAQILGQVVACEYSLPAAPQGYELDATKVAVKFVDGAKREFSVPLVNGADCGTSNQGWYWTPDNRISLCLATCGLVRADALSGIVVQYGCEDAIL